MSKENICFSSKSIELAENENYIELTNRLCYYTEPNLNGVALVYDEFSDEKAKTLVDMPVVAKYTTNSIGEPTFKGHEVYYDEDGNLYFGTDNIGTHIETYIKDDTVMFEREPLQQIAADGVMHAYKHTGFWKPMDMLKDNLELEKMWSTGNAPWKVW